MQIVSRYQWEKIVLLLVSLAGHSQTHGNHVARILPDDNLVLSFLAMVSFFVPILYLTASFQQCTNISPGKNVLQKYILCFMTSQKTNFSSAQFFSQHLKCWTPMCRNFSVLELIMNNRLDTAIVYLISFINFIQYYSLVTFNKLVNVMNVFWVLFLFLVGMDESNFVHHFLSVFKYIIKQK